MKNEAWTLAFLVSKKQAHGLNKVPERSYSSKIWLRQFTNEESCRAQKGLLTKGECELCSSDG